MMTVGAVRFIANGWIERFFETPTLFFHYDGFAWVEVLPTWAMHGLFWLMAILGLCVAAGLFYRPAMILLGVAFTYVELIDVTNYLNHYYLVTLLCVVCAVLPLNRMWSLDARRRPEIARQTTPAGAYGLLRFQVGLVWIFAGVAKLTTDWLIHGQPLGIWLSARTDAWLIGGMLDQPWVALAFSWAGMLHDLLIVPALLWRPTRTVAFAVMLAFHLVTGWLFHIGMFPVIMIIGATVFLSPSWPRRAAAWIGLQPASLPPASTVSSRVSRPLMALAIVWCTAQVAIPLRTFAHDGDVAWHERGMRFSWRVMVREKNGSVDYRVHIDGRERPLVVSPRRYLTAHQAREMSGQPDLIAQLAHHIAADYRSRGVEVRAVYVDALASLNGRPPAPLIDPAFNLIAIDDVVERAAWIRPAPTTDPIHLRPVRWAQPTR